MMYYQIDNLSKEIEIIKPNIILELKKYHNQSVALPWFMPNDGVQKIGERINTFCNWDYPSWGIERKKIKKNEQRKTFVGK